MAGKPGVQQCVRVRLTLTHRNKTKGEKWKVIQLKTELLLLLLFIQSYPTLWDPMGYSPPGSSVLGISQARILEQVAIYFSRGSFNPGVELGFPVLQMDSLSSEPSGLTHSFFFFNFFLTLISIWLISFQQPSMVCSQARLKCKFKQAPKHRKLY